MEIALQRHKYTDTDRETQLYRRMSISETKEHTHSKM